MEEMTRCNFSTFAVQTQSLNFLKWKLIVRDTKMPRSKGMLTCANEMKTFIALCDGNSDITIIT